jgi:hypothetical protein
MAATVDATSAAAPPAVVATCTRCHTALETGDLRCAVCAMIAPTTAASTEASESTARASVLRCTECGAAVAFVAEAQAPKCAFCGAVSKVEQPHDPIEQPAFVAPFLVDRTAAQAALKRWLGSRGWLYPRDLSSSSAVDKIEPLRWAAWLVDADAHVTWAADSDHDNHRSAWAPHAGQDRMTFASIVVPASRGLTHAECRDLAGAYQVDTLTALAATGAAAPDAAPDAVVEGFEAQRSAARKIVMDGIESTAAHRLTQGIIPGRKFRKVHTSVLLARLETRRVALPAWVLAYSYRGKRYRAVVHGQNHHVVIGKAPYAVWKILLLVGAGVALVAGILALLASR